MPRPPNARLLPVLALLVGVVAGCGDGGGRERPNILILSIDTLRADRLGCYGNDEWGTSPSPAIDALAARGLLFEDCTAPRGQTRPSLSSMLTGKYPATTGVRDNRIPLINVHRTLIEYLDEAGYRTGVFAANLNKALPIGSWAYRAADVGQDGYGDSWQLETRDEARFQAIWDERVTSNALDFLDRVDPDTPFALWAHLYDLHKPYNPPEGYDLYGKSDALPEPLREVDLRTIGAAQGMIDAITLGEVEPTEAVLRRIRGLYDGTLRSSDEHIGRILDKLDERGLTEDTIVVFTSDHGEELFDRNRYFYHGASIYQGVLRIPLIVAGPGIPAGARYEPIVQNLDLMPTLLERAGLPVPDDVEGVSLNAVLAGDLEQRPRAFAYFEWQDVIYSVTDGVHKYVHNPEHVHPRKSPFHLLPEGQGYPIECFEAYHLPSDPREANNLVGHLDPSTLIRPTALPPQIQPLRRALDAFLRDERHSLVWVPDAEALDAESAKYLSALGYVMHPQGGVADATRAEPCAR